MVDNLQVYGLILLFCFLACGDPNGHSQLFKDYFEPYPNYISAVIRDNDQLTGPGGEGLMAYEERNFEDAVRLLQLEIQAEPSDSLAAEMRFYLALSHMELGNMKAAVPILERLPKIADFRFKRQGIWYLALAYLKINKSADAQSLLGNLTEADDNYSRKAISLLHQLE